MSDIQDICREKTRKRVISTVNEVFRKLSETFSETFLVGLAIKFLL